MRVYVVDDDPLARRMVSRLLGSMDVQCEEFGSAAAFLAKLDNLTTGCVLLDIGMPGENGLDVLGHIVARRPFPVIMMSGTTDVNDAIRSFRGGAVHFIRKPFKRQALIDTLEEAWEIGLQREAAAARQAQASRIKLTAREREVLQAMSDGHQTKSIAWMLGLSIRTVDMHRSNILDKLKAKNGPQAIAIARTLTLLPERFVGLALSGTDPGAPPCLSHLKARAGSPSVGLEDGA